MIRFENVGVSFGGKMIINGLSAQLSDRGVIAVLGPSGAGKTTLLRIIAGLIRPTSGTVEGLTHERVAMVFQEDRLLPNLSALENVKLVDGCLDASEALELVELGEHAHKRPRELSGGMQRRVAIARAMRFGGNILILDEPFKGLDEELKLRIASRLKGRFPLTVIATHDIEEAKLLGDCAILEVK